MRVKTGIVRRKKHKKVLALTKGYRMTKSKHYKRAKEASLHAGQYAFIGRKRRKRDFRRLWIQRIKAGLKEYGLKYSEFINLLKKEKITIDRKVMAHLALKEPELFKAVVEKATSDGQGAK